MLRRPGLSIRYPLPRLSPVFGALDRCIVLASTEKTVHIFDIKFSVTFPFFKALSAPAPFLSPIAPSSFASRGPDTHSTTANSKLIFFYQTNFPSILFHQHLVLVEAGYRHWQSFLGIVRI